MPQHPSQRLAVVLDRSLSNTRSGRAIEAALLGLGRVLEQPRAHHRRQRQRNHRRNQDRHASVTANSRNSRPTMSPMNSSGISTAISETVSETIVKPICSAPFQRGLKRRLAFFDIARDVLDHHDRVVDDEAGRDRQRHQRQIVQAVAEQVHHAERADQRQRHRDAGDDASPPDCAGTGRSPSRPARWSASARTARPPPRRGSWWCGRSESRP